MFTKADKKFLKETFLTKDTGVTKDDLKDSLNDMRSQIMDSMDGKLVAQKNEILSEVDKKFDIKLAKQKDEIVKDVADYIAESIVPMFDKHEKKFTKIEHHLGIALSE